MLPFPRMTKYGNQIIIDRTYELNLDFSQQQIGDTFVRDYSYRNRIFTKLNTASASIVRDSTLNSNVMSFNGGVFSTPMSAGLQLKGLHFEFDVMYKRNTSVSTIQVLYGTGYYPDVPNNIPGIAHQIMQYEGMDQYFVQSTTFSRQTIPGMSNTDWQRLVYRRDQTGVTISRYINVVKVNEITYPVLDFDNGTAFGVGGYYQTPSQWRFFGYMQYLKLKILP